MTEPKIHSGETHITTHQVQIDERQLLDMLEAWVRSKTKVDREHGVTFKARLWKEDRGTRFEFRAEATLTIDHNHVEDIEYEQKDEG